MWYCKIITIEQRLAEETERVLLLFVQHHLSESLSLVRRQAVWSQELSNEGAGLHSSYTQTFNV